MWMDVGWTLYNISDSKKCLEIWDEFSMLGSSYKPGECSTSWSKMEKRGMTIGTLKYWAKLDDVSSPSIMKSLTIIYFLFLI